MSVVTGSLLNEGGGLFGAREKLYVSILSIGKSSRYLRMEGLNGEMERNLLRLLKW